MFLLLISTAAIGQSNSRLGNEKKPTIEETSEKITNQIHAEKSKIERRALTLKKQTEDQKIITIRDSVTKKHEKQIKHVSNLKKQKN
ncbi:hypothetical protein [Flavobacterium suncheonense]|nr:hypothetical protein [Flavobacterium suncheonense]